MSVVNIELQGTERLDQAEKLLAGVPGAFDKAVRSAMSRAVSKMKTESTKAIRERYDISADRVRSSQDVKVEYSLGEGASVTVRFMGSKFKLAHFSGPVADQTHMLDTSRWVHVQHYRTGNWITVHPSVSAKGHQLTATAPIPFEHAFPLQVGNHLGIFANDGGKPKEIMGSSVPNMLGQETVAEKLEGPVMDTFFDRLEHEITLRLNGII